MSIDIIQSAAQHAEAVLGSERFRYVCAVVANAKLLGEEVEAEGTYRVALDALTLAAYFHDLSTASGAFHNHHIQSAAMAVEFLQQLDAPVPLIVQVEQAILLHTTAIPREKRTVASLEGQILYDADQLGRLSGLAVTTALLEYGAHHPEHTITGEGLVSMLRHIEARFVELYQSLHTAPARRLAQDKFNRTVAFLDGVIEHLWHVTSV